MRKTLQTSLRFLLLSTPVVLYCLPLLRHLNNLGQYDWDLFFAVHEALRRTILTYHQWPWWNPWIAGGTPLFANPNAGLISLQTPFVLLFGTVAGLKIGAVAYFLAGFWGMYCFARRFKAERAQAAFLSYVWTFSSFTAFHLSVGHYVFLMYLLVPWLVYLYARKDESLVWAIGFGFFIALYINASLHYVVVQSLFMLVCAMGVELCVRRLRARLLLADLTAGLVALVLSAPRLPLAIQYISEFPREVPQVPIEIGLAVRAFVSPFQKITDATSYPYGWWEVSSYIGLTTLVAFALAWIASRIRVPKNQYWPTVWLGLAAAGTFVVGLGPFSAYAPYSVISTLPVFRLMHVSTRWFGWTLLFLTLSIAAFRDYRKVLIALLSLASLELFLHHRPLLDPFKHSLAIKPTNQQFEQFDHYQGAVPNSTSMYQAMLQNYGEIRGVEPILGYDVNRPTQRCGINHGCTFVSSNATVTYWSPNRIHIRRQGTGPIYLNMNPSSYWTVNGQRIFRHFRVVEPNELFVVDDPSESIVLAIRPLPALWGN